MSGMFTVIGNEILYDNTTIADFRDTLAPSFRELVEVELKGIEYITEEMQDQAVEDACDNLREEFVEELNDLIEKYNK